MKKKLFIIVLMSILYSCDSNENCCTNNETDLLISIKNPKGDDLLDPIHGEINIESFKLYYMKESGELVLFNKPNLDIPKGFKLIVPDESNAKSYTVLLYLNTDYIDDENTSTTIISWGKGKEYKIKAFFSKVNNGLIANKIFINNTLVVDEGKQRIATIVD